MNKRCTNSSCRKTFSTLTYGATCPFCGKVYPQLARTACSKRKMNMWIGGKRVVFKLEEIERHRLLGKRVRGIIAVKREFERHGYTVSIMAARAFYESLGSRESRMDMWREVPDPGTDDRRIEPVY